MKKLFLILLLALLVACGQSVGERETAVTTSAPTTAVPATQPATPVETDEPADTAPPVESDTFPVAGTVAEASQVRPSDWTKGAVNPLVSIIEYGDFQ